MHTRTIHFIIRLDHLHMKSYPKLTETNGYHFTHFKISFGLALSIHENLLFPVCIYVTLGLIFCCHV